jgi:hypothetical protein
VRRWDGQLVVPSISVLGDDVVVVTAEGKSSTSTAHATPTFMSAFRSTDHGRTFGPPRNRSAAGDRAGVSRRQRGVRTLREPRS